MDPVVDIPDPPAALRNLITADQAWHYQVVPKDEVDNTIIFFSGRSDATLPVELQLLLGRNVRIERASADGIERALAANYRRGAQATRRIDLSSRKAEDILGDLVEEARQLGSSDIHLEVFNDHARVRIRIDGQLVERYRYPKQDHAPVINRVKVQAGLDISEKRLPQDGRMLVQTNDWNGDVRVSVLPTLYGEKVVLRLLGQDASRLDLASLGMTERQLDDYRLGIRKTHGIVLISGPTGSGKTTTLYATLKLLNEVRRNVLTIEDPIEYTLPGINQVQLKEAIGLDFPKALRTFLRQDPDVIMVGEIRDPDTAQMAIRAALTGHLVLSTIHTNSAWGTVSRLLDMGIPSFLLASTLNLSVAQRLLRTLCGHCKQDSRLTPEAAMALGLRVDQPIDHATASGCPKCHYTGYSGRTAIHEVVLLDRVLAAHVRDRGAEEPMELRERGVDDLAKRAFDLVLERKTSLEEALPICTR